MCSLKYFLCVIAKEVMNKSISFKELDNNNILVVSSLKFLTIEKLPPLHDVLMVWLSKKSLLDKKFVSLA